MITALLPGPMWTPAFAQRLMAKPPSSQCGEAAAQFAASKSKPNADPDPFWLAVRPLISTRPCGLPRLMIRTASVIAGSGVSGVIVHVDGAPERFTSISSGVVPEFGLAFAE